MNYQTILETATNWLFSDTDNFVVLVATLAIIGALNGVRRSLQRCNGGHIGRKVL